MEPKALENYVLVLKLILITARPLSVSYSTADIANKVAPCDPETDPNIKANPVANGANVTSSNSFASGSNMNCGNVITDRPSSRVLNPPGGKSSITLG